MDPGGPPRPAPSYAGGRGEASSSSSPRQPPPLPPQQGHAIPPVPLRQPSLPVDHGANAFPSGLEPLERRIGEMYLRDSPPSAPVDASRSAVYDYGSASSSQRPPPPQQQQGHAIQPPPPWGVGAGAFPFGFGPPVPGQVPPLHPQFGPPLGMVWGPSSNTSQHLDAMVAQQRSAAPTWPQQPQFGQHQPQFGPPPLQPPPPPLPIHQDWRLAQIRSELLRSPMTLEQLVMSPENSAILVHQLNVGDEEMCKMVLDAFAQCAHGIMESWQGHAVFEALLGSLHERYVELEIIVKAAVTPSLVSRSDDGVGVASLELLMTALEGFPNLSARLVNSFVNERVMDDVGGDKLIARCFTTMPTYVTTVLINHAIATIDDKMESPSGSTFLTTCFGFARGEAAERFKTTILDRAVAMAKKRSGKRFVLHLLDHASSMEFREQLASKLMQNVLELSVNSQGQFVLENCFQNEEKELLNIVLRACADLTAGDLQTLVRQPASRHFVLPHLHSLLERGNTDFPVTARRLALKIQALPLRIRELDEFELLMPAVTRVLADNPANLGD